MGKSGILHHEMSHVPDGGIVSHKGIVINESRRYWWVRDAENGRDRRFRKLDGMLVEGTAYPGVSLHFEIGESK
ncbi:MAG: hypothetical protein V3R83_09760 [Gammaproteobacteria bacterium]